VSITASSNMVIKPTVKEINAVSDIEITPEFKRSGRSITEIRFIIGANPQLTLLDINDDKAVRGTTIYQRLVASGISHKLAESWITQHGEDYCAEKLDIVDAQKASGAKIVSVAGFLSAAIKDDYQSGVAQPSKADKAKAAARDTARREQAEAEQAARRQESEIRESKKRDLLDRIKAARDWFETHSAAEQARILDRFELTLDKPFLRADFKRAKLDSAGVAARFADFVDF